MEREILVNCSTEEIRVAILEDGRLAELLVERRSASKIVGNIYKGRVENVLPGISSAFVNTGLEKNAYLYVTDVIAAQRERNIDQMLKRNEEILVQVAKEAIGTKGVKVSMNLALPGRFLVYMPFSPHLGISKNITERSERDRLRTILEGLRPAQGGYIVRTEAEGAEERELRREVKYLTRLWENVHRRAETSQAPSLLHRDLGLVFQTARDLFNESTKIFLLDSKAECRDLKEFVELLSPELSARVQLYEGNTPILSAFGVEEQLEKIRDARVNIPSGGYIVVQEAEGLCAIDVNTGKFTGHQSQEETVTTTNLEAAAEVGRQLRLRNIGGIIVIDFIDMKRAKNRQRVTEALTQAVKYDRAKIKILPITRLGLVEMTRERKRESLLSLLGEICPECGGRGRVLSRESLFIKVKKEILDLTHGRPGDSIRLQLHPTVAEFFQERLERLERTVRHRLILDSDPALPWEDYRILIA